MPHSFNKIWIHAVWSTKERLPLISPIVENTVHQYMSQQLDELGCPVGIINGMPDHIHCLFLQNPQKSVADTIKQIKGSTSHYINQNNVIHTKFAWQTGYAAFSVSESGLDKVFSYIRNQKNHHRTRTFQEELDLLLEHHGFDGGSKD